MANVLEPETRTLACRRLRYLNLGVAMTSKPPPPSSAPALVDGWEETHTEAGDVYYYNTTTGEARWEPPTL